MSPPDLDSDVIVDFYGSTVRGEKTSNSGKNARKTAEPTPLAVGRPDGVHLAFHVGMELEHLVRRVKAEFLEMPGLRLTDRQAARLWGLERALCDTVVDILVGSAFLRRTQGGVISRNDS